MGSCLARRYLNRKAHDPLDNYIVGSRDRQPIALFLPESATSEHLAIMDRAFFIASAIYFGLAVIVRWFTDASWRVPFNVHWAETFTLYAVDEQMKVSTLRHVFQRPGNPVPRYVIIPSNPICMYTRGAGDRDSCA
jgi:hypothetical protein